MKIHSLPQDIFHEMIDPQVLEQSPERMSETLAYLAKKIAQVMKADVCSLYLYNSESDTLTLKATYGLNKDLIDRLTFKVGVGLTGMTLKFLKPITVSNVAKSKSFLLIPGLGEEDFKSFLSIPLLYAQKPLGVMVVQNRKPTPYRKKDIQLLLSLSIPAISVIERAKLKGTMASLHGDDKTPADAKKQTRVEYLKDHILHGISASRGIAIAPLKIVQAESWELQPISLPFTPEIQKEKFLEALDWVKKDVAETRDKAALKFGPEELGIFEAYALLLENKSFENQILERIDDNNSAAKAIETIIGKYIERISNSDDEYIRERSYDLQDVAQKIINRLLYGDQKPNQMLFHSETPVIFLHENWSISDFTILDPQTVKGILSPQGGANSHVSLLADAASLPAVFGLGSAAGQLKDGDLIIMDGNSGLVIVNPTKETLTAYSKAMSELENQKKVYLKSKTKKIHLERKPGEAKFLPIGANIELVPHVELALQCGADEVGLYRTEFPFLTASHLPTEEEQFTHYTQVVKWMKGREVTFRTLDIGGDKYIPYLDLPHESNPFLGWRSIRFSLARRDLFRIQLRALIRTGEYGKIRILFPMITSLEEVIEIEKTIATVRKELQDEGEELTQKIPIGFMIEVPAAAEIASTLAERADFLSIGTNDLIQYGLAIDRTNPLVAHLYDPYHPAILKMIERTVKGAHKAGIPVSVCGETAARPDLAALMVGLGVDSLSMNPQSIPRIKHFFKNAEAAKWENLAQKALKLGSGSQIRRFLANVFIKNGWEEYFDNPADGEKAARPAFKN